MYDAGLAAGLIDEKSAKARRKELEDERRLDRPFKKQTCATCDGHQKMRGCISNEAWEIKNSRVKVSCWADKLCNACEECGQQQLIIQSGNTKALFKGFIS